MQTYCGQLSSVMSLYMAKGKKINKNLLLASPVEENAQLILNTVKSSSLCVLLDDCSLD